MEKLATNVDEQIVKLESRGMTIGDKDKAKECLLDIGYFRLGFYWFPFEKSYPRKVNRTHEFKDGACFEYAIRLYYFDYDLRNILLKYINRVEINFRTKLIYHASNRYKQDPFWYQDSKYVNKAFLEDDVMEKAMKDASKEDVIIQDMKAHKRSISPAWKAMEFFSFGAAISLYDNLKEGPLKCEISNLYGMSSPNNFLSYIDTVRKLRNYCAHGKVLFDKNLPEAISNGPLGYLGNSKTQLYGAYCVLKYLLGCVSENRAQDMQQEVKALFDQMPNDIVKQIILQNSGFQLAKL
jgi:abortive infection bacteriophage resistance protein